MYFDVRNADQGYSIDEVYGLVQSAYGANIKITPAIAKRTLTA